MLVQSKLEHCSVIGSYLELQILDLGLHYMDGKLRHRPKTFMRSPRFKKAVFKSKLQTTTEKSKYILQPRHCSVFSLYLEFQKSKCIDSYFFGKLRQFSRTCMRLSIQMLMLAMTFSSDKKIRIVTKSRCGHPLNNQSSNQQFWILAYKRRHLPYIQASWLFRSRSCSCSLPLYFVMFKFYSMLYFP